MCILILMGLVFFLFIFFIVFCFSQMVWRNSYNGSSNNNDINVKDQNGNDPSSPTYVPHFNHSYHPVAPGYSITARSLSTKFREELKYDIEIDICFLSIDFDDFEIQIIHTEIHSNLSFHSNHLILFLFLFHFFNFFLRTGMQRMTVKTKMVVAVWAPNVHLVPYWRSWCQAFWKIISHSSKIYVKNRKTKNRKWSE